MFYTAALLSLGCRLEWPALQHRLGVARFVAEAKQRQREQGEHGKEGGRGKQKPKGKSSTKGKQDDSARAAVKAAKAAKSNPKYVAALESQNGEAGAMRAAFALIERRRVLITSGPRAFESSIWSVQKILRYSGENETN